MARRFFQPKCYSSQNATNRTSLTFPSNAAIFITEMNIDHISQIAGIWIKEALIFMDLRLILLSSLFHGGMKLDSEMVEPNAMTLATVNKEGQPSARIVLLKGVTHEGLNFILQLPKS